MKRQREESSSSNNNDNEHKKTSKTATTNSPTILYPKLYNESIQDAKDNLDYIISFGQQIYEKKQFQRLWKDDNRNRFRFLQCNKNNQYDNDYNVSSLTSSSSSKVTSHSKKKNNNLRIKSRKNNYLIHSEDHFLYNEMSNYIKRKGIKQHKDKHKQSCTLFQWPISRNIHNILSRCRNDDDNNNNNNHDNNITDDAWEEEYGDGLIYEEIQNKFDVNLEQENKIIDEMIHRAWDRAIHVASTTIGVDLDMTNTSDTSNVSCSNTSYISNNKSESSIVTNIPDPNQDNNNNHYNEEKSIDSINHKMTHLQQMINQVSPNQINSIMKCKSLGITFDPIQVYTQDGHNNNDKDDTLYYYKCPSCHIVYNFISKEEIMTHLFGSSLPSNDEEDDLVKGCCWKLIHEKHCQVVKSILEREQNHIIDGLLHILFQKGIKRMKYVEDCRSNDGSSNKMNNDNDDVGKNPHHISDVMNWVDVLSFMKEEIDETTIHCTNNCSEEEEAVVAVGCNEKTIQVHDKILPITLNKDVLKVVIGKAVNRYGVMNDNKS